MSELQTLASIAWTRHRHVAIGLTLLAVIGEVAALSAHAWFDLSSGGAQATLFIILMPICIASLGLFDYGLEKDLMSPESGCHGWILRLPVAAWKISLPPIVMRSLWVAGLWCLFALTSQGFGNAEMPVIAPGFCLAAGTLSVVAVSWQPFEWIWSRLICMGLASLVVLTLFVFSMNTGYGRYQAWYPLVTVAAIALYASSVIATVKAVHTARTSPWGVVPETGKRSNPSMLSEPPRRVFANSIRALVWHDLAQAKGRIRYTLFLFVLPTILLGGLLLPFGIQSLILMNIAFVYWGAIAISGIGGKADFNMPSSLPPYLSVSPIPSASLAWTRLLTILGTCIAVFSLIGLLYLVWMIFPSNRNAWLNWAATQTAAYELPESTKVITGMRCMSAITLASLLFVTSRIAAFLWVGISGRTWFISTVISLVSATILTIIGLATGWVLQQTDWDSARASIDQMLQHVPTLIGAVLIAKLVAVIASTATLYRKRLAGGDQIAIVFAAWIGITLVVATTANVLIPDPRASFLWCLVGATILLPLARVILLPVSLGWNRHR